MKPVEKLRCLSPIDEDISELGKAGLVLWALSASLPLLLRAWCFAGASRRGAELDFSGAQQCGMHLVKARWKKIATMVEYESAKWYVGSDGGVEPRTVPTLGLRTDAPLLSSRTSLLLSLLLPFLFSLLLIEKSSVPIAKTSHLE